MDNFVTRSYCSGSSFASGNGGKANKALHREKLHYAVQAVQAGEPLTAKETDQIPRLGGIQPQKTSRKDKANPQRSWPFSIEQASAMKNAALLMGFRYLYHRRSSFLPQFDLQAFQTIFRFSRRVIKSCFRKFLALVATHVAYCQWLRQASVVPRGPSHGHS